MSTADITRLQWPQEVEPAALAPLKTFTDEDLYAFPKVRWLIEDLIPEQSHGAFYGPSGQGKTWNVLHLAMCLATGTRFFDRTVRQCKPLVVCAEGFRSGFADRRRAWDLKYGEGRGEPNPNIVYAEALNLTTDMDIERVARFVEAEGVDVVIFDTVAANAPGLQEDNPSYSALLGEVRQELINRCGVTVIWVHHAPANDPEKLRGGTAFFAALDWAICVPEKGQWKVTKQRDGQSQDVVKRWTLQGVPLGHHDEYGKAVWSAVVEELSNVVPETGDLREAWCMEVLRAEVPEHLSGGLTKTQWGQAMVDRWTPGSPYPKRSSKQYRNWITDHVLCHDGARAQYVEESGRRYRPKAWDTDPEVF